MRSQFRCLWHYVCVCARLAVCSRPHSIIIFNKMFGGFGSYSRFYFFFVCTRRSSKQVECVLHSLDAWDHLLMILLYSTYFVSFALSSPRNARWAHIIETHKTQARTKCLNWDVNEWWRKKNRRRSILNVRPIESIWRCMTNAQVAPYQQPRSRDSQVAGSSQIEMTHPKKIIIKKPADEIF